MDFQPRFSIVAIVMMGLLLAGAVIWLPGARAQGGDPLPATGRTDGEEAPSATLSSTASVGSAFTYQGRLEQGDAPYDGACDFDFYLYDAASGGHQVGSNAMLVSIPVSDGVFTVDIDFGTGAFDGQARWLEIRLRCPAGGVGWTILGPRQELTAAPYAHSLRPGAIITGSLPAGIFGAINVYSSGEGFKVERAATIGVDVVQAGTIGLAIGSTGQNGVYVDQAGSDGLFVCSTGNQSGCTPSPLNNGLEVGNAEGVGVLVVQADTGVAVDAASYGMTVSQAGVEAIYVANAGRDGVRVDVAGGDGFSVFNAGTPSTLNVSALDNGLEVAGAAGNGLYVGHADRSGLYVCSTGSETTCTPSDLSHGLEVGRAQYHGVFVDYAGYNGMQVNETGFDGLYVGSAGRDGVRVVSATDNGVEAAGTNLAGYFAGNVEITGTCTGCTLATFAVNSGQQALEPGAIVTIQGARAAEFDAVPALLEVAAAVPGQPIVGVVQGRAEIVNVEEPRPQESPRRLIPREGVAGPGEYVTIITHGVVQVAGSNVAGTVTPGAKLALDDDGRGRVMRTVEIEGVQVAENAPILGIALSQPDEAGMVWVLVNPQ